MPLRLKNARATYQRAMVTLSHDIMYKEIEDYVDDMIFISRLTEKSDPIFRLLKKHNPGVWDKECQKTFDKVKHYLFNAPILMPPSPDKPLILYLAVFGNSIGCVLGQHDELGKKTRAIYYLNKNFIEYEIRYSPIEKLCCTLIWTTWRLR
ncbi:RNA-directed DNA polymerase (Reverse transcriptase), Ribonuclease H [Gossypium australe]|uniref:RNA-directed DNA polymerase (Reverse transcriptase), Ribonuclease H n=1 Tax=Gossypium australe TaxID=47621 RepID=A0A5B6WX17_9ROSI|nr:RNA-directed DNA polymerase (Reverse transcriptase), Ribonuclease H [Gossypium australe]